MWWTSLNQTTVLYFWAVRITLNLVRHFVALVTCYSLLSFREVKEIQKRKMSFFKMLMSQIIIYIMQTWTCFEQRKKRTKLLVGICISIYCTFGVLMVRCFILFIPICLLFCVLTFYKQIFFKCT